MIHRQAKLSAEDLNKLAQLESSVQNWAVQHSNLHMQANHALSQINAMTQARNQLLQAAYDSAGIDSNTIQDIRISRNPQTKEGLIEVMCAEPPPPEPPSPSTETPAATNGAATTSPPEASEEPSKDATPTS